MPAVNVVHRISIKIEGRSRSTVATASAVSHVQVLIIGQAFLAPDARVSSALQGLTGGLLNFLLVPLLQGKVVLSALINEAPADYGYKYAPHERYILRQFLKLLQCTLSYLGAREW